MRGISPFKRLGWRLTLAYTVVTAIASAVLLAAFLVFIAAVIFRSDDLPRALAQALAAKTEEIRPAVLARDRAEVARWFRELARRGPWYIINTGWLQYSLDLDASGEAVVWVFDADGGLLGVNQADTDAAPAGLAGQLLAAASAGQADPDQLFGREASFFYAAAPIFNEAGGVAGVLLVRADSTDEEANFLPAIALVSLLPTLCVMTPIAGVIGLFFGFIIAQGLTRRLGKMAQAAEAWSLGDFSALVRDQSQDELGHLARRLNGMAQQLQTLLATRQELAVAEERNRLALDLHDSVKQQAFAASAQLGAARALLRQDPAAAEARLRQAEELMDGLRQELAHLILELRPPALEGRGLAAALRDYAADWSRQTGLPADCRLSSEGRLTPEQEQALYRIAQEALANVARHSGARRVEIVLDYRPDGAVLTLADDGAGFDLAEAPSGVGLRSMQERAAALGGTLQVESAPERGTRVSVWVPGPGATEQKP